MTRPTSPASASRGASARLRRGTLLALVTLLIVVAIAWPASSQPDDDVLKVIPENYKLLFENAFVRVIEARVPPGTVEPPHRHMRGVSVCMTEYTIESRAVPDGEWVRSQRKLGTVYWSESSLHQLRNVGTTPSHTIRIELKY
jgi:hypothetical protein